jgi:hypothetical protein
MFFKTSLTHLNEHCYYLLVLVRILQRNNQLDRERDREREREIERERDTLWRTGSWVRCPQSLSVSQRPRKAGDAVSIQTWRPENYDSPRSESNSKSKESRIQQCPHPWAGERGSLSSSRQQTCFSSASLSTQTFNGWNDATSIGDSHLFSSVWF